MVLSVSIRKQYADYSLDIDFESDHKRIGILGASGCGKSLTLKSIAGIIRPEAGRISFGTDVWFDKHKKVNMKPAGRNVGYLFQNYALFPNMTVEENIAAALHGTGRDHTAHAGSMDVIVKDLMKRYELLDIKDHRPDELSGGQQQRCALARLMARDPGLLLLDEPFSAMDAYLREGMRLELIRRLDEYDKTVIMVSHDRDEIYQMCDYLILMDRGRVIDQGDTDAIFAHPSTDTAARLTGCKNISRIIRLGEHRIRALDWNDLELVTAGKVTGDITHIGIRAHDFIPGRFGENTIPCGRVTISRLPFEWYVILENGLWWKQGRALDEARNKDGMPQYISISPDKIILLKSR